MSDAVEPTFGPFTPSEINQCFEEIDVDKNKFIGASDLQVFVLSHFRHVPNPVSKLD